MLAILPRANGSSADAEPPLAHRGGVDLARLVVLAAVVVGDRQVERRLGVARVDLERRLEGLLRVGEAPLVVIDDAEHVEDVGEPAVLLHDLREVLLGLVVLASLVVVAPERDELPEPVVHGRPV
jgi:hypothetical protein